MRTRLLTLFYLSNGVATIVFGELGFSLPAFITKAMIIPILLVIFLESLWPFKEKLQWVMVAGLTFSWIGDILLEFTGRNENMFLFGLASFMLAQLMYTYLFFTTSGKNSLLTSRKYLLIPIIASGAGLIIFLFDDLGTMRIPVIVYAAAIVSMVAGAVNRIDKVNRNSFYLVLAGAILFLISDSTIAINKFSFRFELSSIVVMSTYIAAQYLITTGYIKQHNPSRGQING